MQGWQYTESFRCECGASIRVRPLTGRSRFDEKTIEAQLSDPENIMWYVKVIRVEDDIREVSVWKASSVEKNVAGFRYTLLEDVCHALIEKDFPPLNKTQALKLIQRYKNLEVFK